MPIARMAAFVRLPFATRARPPAIRRRLVDLWSLHRQRTRLSELDARMLDDIGRSPNEAARESARPVWDVPDPWHD